MTLYLCCSVTACHTDVLVSLCGVLRVCLMIKRPESAEPHKDGLLYHRHIYTNPKQKGSNLKKIHFVSLWFFSIKMLKVCTKVCVSLKHKLQREYIRVKNQKCSRCFDKTATPSSIQLGLQDLAPGLRVQRRQLPAAQLVRRPHVAEPSNQPVFLHKAADVVPHQDHLRTGNRKRSESSSAVSGWR